MSSLPMTGFMIAAAMAVGVADYLTQAKVAKAPIGAYSLSTYVDTLELRVEEAEERRRLAARAAEIEAAARALEEANDPKAELTLIQYISAKHEASKSNMVSATRFSEEYGNQAKPDVKRINLSGGRSCLSGSTGGFCQ